MALFANVMVDVGAESVSPYLYNTAVAVELLSIRIDVTFQDEALYFLAISAMAFSRTVGDADAGADSGRVSGSHQRGAVDIDCWRCAVGNSHDFLDEPCICSVHVCQDVQYSRFCRCYIGGRVGCADVHCGIYRFQTDI